jgi:hypothetical protein
VHVHRVISYVLLAGCLFLAWVGFENANQAATEAMGAGLAKAAACSIDAACVLRTGPNVMRADVLRRRYQYETDQGPVTVTCDRQYIWLGEWSCRSARGPL